MDTYIRMGKIDRDRRSPGAEGVWEKNILPKEIAGVTTNYAIIEKEKEHTLQPYATEGRAKARVILFTRGRCMISIPNHTYKVKEMAIFCPTLDTAVTVNAEDCDIEYLEVLIDLTQTESTNRESTNKKLPFFLHYSECDRYREEIKSDKSINRTFLPVDIIPRLAIGSVETVGPDTVEAHRHPMLEQLFYGLPGNHCCLKVDEQEVAFEENVLLHIPLGSVHGVGVEEDNILHYLWLDFFRSERDTSYIADSHIPIDLND
jgi:hypothetical protein